MKGQMRGGEEGDNERGKQILATVDLEDVVPTGSQIPLSVPKTKIDWLTMQ